MAGYKIADASDGPGCSADVEVAVTAIGTLERGSSRFEYTTAAKIKTYEREALIAAESVTIFEMNMLKSGQEVKVYLYKQHNCGQRAARRSLFSRSAPMEKRKGSFVQVLQLFVPLWAPFTHENGANY
jgi:hypothetical protein